MRLIGLGRCPYCNSDEIYCSGARSTWEKFMFLVLLRPVRCHRCMHRHYAPIFVHPRNLPWGPFLLRRQCVRRQSARRGGRLECRSQAIRRRSRVLNKWKEAKIRQAFTSNNVGYFAGQSGLMLLLTRRQPLTIAPAALGLSPRTKLESNHFKRNCVNAEGF